MTVYTGHYSKRFVPECEACHKGVEMEVTAEMVMVVLLRQRKVKTRQIQKLVGS